MWIFEAGFFDRVRTRDKLIGIGILMGPLVALVVAGAVFLAPEPFDRSLLWGCYIADRAPTLQITQANIRVFQDGVAPLAYVIEPSKTGYHMVVERASALVMGQDGSLGFRREGGSGYFWPLLSKTKHEIREFRKPREFSGLIQVASRSSEPIIYVRDPTAVRCRPL